MLRELAVKPVVTASTRMTATEAARLMRQKNVGALVVVNAGRPLGMLTDRDIAIDVVAQGKDPDTVNVGDIMHKKPITVRDDAGLLDLARTFAKTGVRRLPIVNKGGQLTGILSMDDLMMLLGNEMGHMAGGLAAGLRKAS